MIVVIILRWTRIDICMHFDGVEIYWKCFEKVNRPAGKLE